MRCASFCKNRPRLSETLAHPGGCGHRYVCLDRSASALVVVRLGGQRPPERLRVWFDISRYSKPASASKAQRKVSSTGLPSSSVA